MKVLKSKGAYTDAKQRVFIAIPSYGGITAGTLYSLFGSKEVLLRNGIESELHIFDGNCHVDDGRNFLVREFLETKCTDFVFIDTDVRFDPEDLVRLMLYSPEVVAGIYPLKQEDEDYPVRFPQGEIWGNEEGLIEVDGVPTGFLRIRREVFEKLDKTVPHYKAKQDGPNQRLIPLIFERTMEGTTRWGGDYEFCRKWRAQGGKIFIDPEMLFGHTGSFEWEGSVGHWLRKKNGLLDSFIIHVIEKIREGTETLTDINNLVRAWGNNFAVPAEELMTIIMLARDNEGPVLEAGSGLTSLVLAAIGETKDFNVWSLEHDEIWFEKVAKFKERLGLERLNLVYSRIVDGWYSAKSEGGHTMVLCDGPPRKLGDRTKLLEKDWFAPGCKMIVDDADSSDMTPFVESGKFETFNTFGRYAIGRMK